MQPTSFHSYASPPPPPPPLTIPLQGYQAKNAYIATQGPVPETIEDFWQMVWEQKTPVIVMLTRVDEGGRVRQQHSHTWSWG